MGEKISPFNTISDIVTIPGGGSIAIDPGSTEFAIDNIGASLWTIAPADVNPAITVGFQNAAGHADCFKDLGSNADMRPSLYVYGFFHPSRLPDSFHRRSRCEGWIYRA